jgi:predicted nucleic acid-binding protein
LRTAVDTSVLLAVAEKEPGHEKWERLLRQAAEEGGLCVCPVVFAELSPAISSAEILQSQLAMLAIEYDDFSPESAHHAGVIFWKYRQAGGPREHLLPDFLVAAHAQIQCGRLAAIDRGYFRQYFPKLKILRPN